MIDGGPGANPPGTLDAWLVTDERAELIAAIRRLAAKKGLVPHAGSFRRDGLSVERRPVVHTNHPTYGYRIQVGHCTIVWAPEFSAFPSWARDADLMFAEGAGWARPIRFVGGVGGTWTYRPSREWRDAQVSGAWCSRTSGAPRCER